MAGVFSGTHTFGALTEDISILVCSIIEDTNVEKYVTGGPTNDIYTSGGTVVLNAARYTKSDP